MVPTMTHYIFHGGDGFLGMGGGGGTIEVDTGPSRAELEADERKKRAKARKRAAEESGSKMGRATTLLTGAGSTANAPTKKATLLGHTSAP